MDRLSKLENDVKMLMNQNNHLQLELNLLKGSVTLVIYEQTINQLKSSVARIAIVNEFSEKNAGKIKSVLEVYFDRVHQLYNKLNHDYANFQIEVSKLMMEFNESLMSCLRQLD